MWVSQVVIDVTLVLRASNGDGIATGHGLQSKKLIIEVAT